MLRKSEFLSQAFRIRAIHLSKFWELLSLHMLQLDLTPFYTKKIDFMFTHHELMWDFRYLVDFDSVITSNNFPNKEID
jgi:hypothetical protein